MGMTFREGIVRRFGRKMKGVGNYDFIKVPPAKG